MRWLLLRLLTDTLGHRQQWKVQSKGGSSLHPLLLCHLASPAENLVETLEEAFTSTLVSSWGLRIGHTSSATSLASDGQLC